MKDSLPLWLGALWTFECLNFDTSHGFPWENQRLKHVWLGTCPFPGGYHPSPSPSKKKYSVSVMLHSLKLTYPLKKRPTPNRTNFILKNHQKTNSRLDCMRVCDTACLKTWNCLRQDMHQWMNELLRTRPAHLWECFPDFFGGSSALKTRILKSNISWRKILHRDFHLTQLAHHAGHQGLILAGGFDLRVFLWPGSNHCVRWPALTRSSRICMPSEESCRTSVTGTSASDAHFDSYGARNRWYASFFELN